MDGKEFRHIRHMTGLTKTRYSQSFGFSLAKITAYESGKRSITPEDAAYAEKIRETFKENYERARIRKYPAHDRNVPDDAISAVRHPAI